MNKLSLVGFSMIMLLGGIFIIVSECFTFGIAVVIVGITSFYLACIFPKSIYERPEMHPIVSLHERLKIKANANVLAHETFTWIGFLAAILGIMATFILIIQGKEPIIAILIPMGIYAAILPRL